MNIFQRAYASLRAKSYEVLFYNRPDDADSSRVWGPQDYLRANEISLYTNRAISKRAEKVSEVEFYLQKVKSKDRVEEHPLLDILNKPNEFQTGLQFWGLYQKYRDLLGSAFIWVETAGDVFNPKAVKGLHLLFPPSVKVEFEDGRIEKYVYRTEGGGTIEFPAEQVIYLYTPDPKRPAQGMSLLTAGARAIDAEVQLATYHSNVIRNGGNVGNIMTFKTPNLTEAQVKQLKEQYTAQYSEAKNAGKPMFLGGEADIKKLGLNPDELAYLESKRMVLDEIVMMTGVPKSILGLTTGETFANADASIAIFLRETIKPLLTDLVTTLDWRFIPEDMELKFTDPTPENVELRLKETETGVRNGYMTINEAREKNGLEPLPEGDVILVPFSVIPLDRVGEEPARDPKEEVDDDEGKKSRVRSHPLRDDFVRERYGKIMVKRMDRSEARVLQAIETYFSGQRRRIIDHIEGVRVFRKKDLVDEIFNHTLEINLAKGTLLPLIRDILKRSGDDAAEFAGATRPFVLSARIESFLDHRSSVFANQITETTFEKLKTEFSQSLEAGESRQQLVERIRSTYTGYSESRARTIARTEVHAATQTGTMEGYKQAGLDTKIWVAVMDSETRDSHAAVDGEEVPIGHVFSNGLMYPGEPTAPAEEVINCRCSI
jgi:HK97 family phage portal protein